MDNYLGDIIKEITKLENESFDGWTQGEINGYLTACTTIKEKIKNINRTVMLDNMDE